jgi:uncharacterized protein
MNLLNDFRKLRNEIEINCKHLHNLHLANTKCKKGCADCCMNFGLLPIEFYTILDDLKRLNFSINKQAIGDECIFLSDNQCTIYDFRPTICRSHGLPILDMDEEGEELQLSFCPLNFALVDDDYFALETSFRQDFYNSKTYMLNQKFLIENPDIKEDERILMDLNELSKFIHV